MQDLTQWLSRMREEMVQGRAQEKRRHEIGNYVLRFTLRRDKIITWSSRSARDFPDRWVLLRLENVRGVEESFISDSG